MPRFDGTGPQGQGPMTGRGQGDCAVRLPRSSQMADGYPGLQGAPLRPGVLASRPMLGARFARWLRPAVRRGFGPGRGRGRRRRW